MARLIDADALMKRYGDTDDVVEIRTKGEWEVYVATIEDFFNTVNSMPTIDAEPVRHGKWEVERSHDGYATGIMECSNCGWLFSYVPALEEEWDCCPHCGARMEGAEDD